MQSVHHVFTVMSFRVSQLQVTGQEGLQLRAEDAKYLERVDRWWAVLLPKIGRLLVERGGNILMVQVLPS